ncbi:HmuY family protein [Gynurincola endophyticus]|uniref:HmuY family protein n=1 Tax=Gynurincola endophyticus TaxID=2479004 RepID=UPI000F8E9912|nr:HmuY family protein [Gynurincola endophyticus]
MERRTLWLLMLTVLLAFTACSKDDDNEPDPEPEPTADFYYKLHRVENFAVENDDSNPTQAKPAVAFSLYNKQEVPTSYLKTNRWDISFSNLYNSFLGGNNGADLNNAGYGGASRGGILILEKHFDEVTEVPANAVFRTASGIIGTDDSGAFGEGIGWYLYDFGGNIVGDGTIQKQHIAYALSEGVTTNDQLTVKPRTIIVKTAKNDYAKIKMISCYKNLFTPEEWYKDAPKMFFTFEYVVIPGGETKFEIKP